MIIETTTAPMLSKSYDPAEVEQRIYRWWEESGFFHAEPDDPGEPFVIVLPPPNVTGSLHMGHALTASIEDALIRQARMQGRNAVWLPGLDHAGIATQAVVERSLAREGVTRQELGREEFLERVREHVRRFGGIIQDQHRRLGASLDWEREAYTLDPLRVRAVREVFCTLYEQGLIYRGTYLTNWDPVLQTALSDIEVEHEQVVGELVSIRYPETGGGKGLVVATTRPETMLGDTAVAVHPDDPRYAHLVGRTLRLPLLDREIPVIADEHVDQGFGTGAVKVTPAHDPNDYEIGQRHSLPAIDVLTETAHINAKGGRYEGLDRYEARARIKADLDALGLLVRVEPHAHSVGHSSRSRSAIEPRLSDQWFVRIRPLADAAAAAVRDGRTRFVPERNAKPFIDWLDNHRDWCISRQLWWGHRIPAWYDAEGNIHVLREDPSPEQVDAQGLRQDADVLDTWFSSQLWPFTTLGWPEQTAELKRWYPNAVVETGYDINTFWVSKMMMMGLHFQGDVPFRAVVNHGMVRDDSGKKMSKSFGNAVDPLDFVDRYGVDALRFALLRLASPGVDLPPPAQWVEGARRFTNKLWNAARFVLASLGDTMPADGLPADAELRPEDRWILSRLERARAEAANAFDALDPSGAARALYAFVWDEYCDWYLELAKLRADDAAPRVLAHVLDTALRLLHPLVPFVTEELWRALVRADERTGLIRAAWPSPAPERVDAAAESEFGVLRETVTELRRFRADLGLAPGAAIDVLAVGSPLPDGAVEGVRRLARVGAWASVGAPPAGEPLGKVVAGGAELFVRLTGLVDVDAERGRLRKELDRAGSEAQRAERKLANDAFVNKAAPEVVAAEREKLASWTTVRAELGEQLALLEAS